MSGLEVVAAVSAVISAFHGGSELLKHVQKKRRARKARDQAQQEWEEQQLQSSLVAGEQQIDLRYKQDQRELGDFIRIGDDIARDRLYHVTLMLQAEIINSLKLAATNEFCVLNLRLLHEASITNRKETFVILDELKQRIYVTRPMARRMGAAFQEPRARQPRASVHTLQRDDYNPDDLRLDDYTPRNKRLPSHLDSWNTGHGLTDYFRANDNTNMPTPTPPAPEHNFNAALDGLRPDHRAEIMENLQQMISSYKGLSVDNSPLEERGHKKYGGGNPERRDTLTMLQGGDSLQHEHWGQDRDPQQMFTQSPPASAERSAAINSGSPPLNQHKFDAQREQHLFNQQHATPNPYPQRQTQRTQPRWSDVSGASSAHSNAASLDRNGSNSSQGSNPRVLPLSSHYSPPLSNARFPPISAPPNAPYQQPDEDRHTLPQPSSPYANAEDRYSPSPIAPLAPLRTGSGPNNPSSAPSKSDADASLSPAPHSEAQSPAHVPWPGTQQHRNSSPTVQYTPPQRYSAPIEEEAVDVRKPTHPQYYITSPAAYSAPSMHSDNSEQTVTPSGFAAVAAAASKLGSATTARIRHASITPSIASTDSSGSSSLPGILPGHRMRSSIRSDTIQSGPAGGEKMMNGRPDKDNDYWGFCKGAWGVREDSKKGLELRTQPLGYYNTKQIWACKSCSFTGNVFNAPNPKKKNKTIEVVDPRINISMSGIRYRWIFLAKSHVKKKTGDNNGTEDNFGCILCSAEGNVTGVYGGVETLMNHIALSHVADMSEMTRRKVNCVLGRVAAANEDFDINVPIFSPVEELAA